MKQIFLLLFLSFFIFQCGGSKLEEGDQQYKNGDYMQALNSYLAYKKSNPDDKSVDAKIALAYMNRGLELYNKTKNLDSFSGNFEKAQQFLENGFSAPENKIEYSDILFALATAYKKSNPQNEIQKEQYFNNTLDYLSQALDNNPDNFKADSLLSQIYQENFQKMFDKGLQFFNRAQKEKNNPDLYLNAEKYLSKAVEFNSSNEDVQKYLSKTRAQTLGILKSNYPLSFCIPNYKQEKTTLFVDLTAQNFSNDPIVFDFKNLELKSFKGEIFKIDNTKTVELKAAIKDKTTIEPRKRIDGQLIFDIQPGTKLESISYVAGPNERVTKYFP